MQSPPLLRCDCWRQVFSAYFALPLRSQNSELIFARKSRFHTLQDHSKLISACFKMLLFLKYNKQRSVEIATSSFSCLWRQSTQCITSSVFDARQLFTAISYRKKDHAVGCVLNFSSRIVQKISIFSQKTWKLIRSPKLTQLFPFDVSQ